MAALGERLGVGASSGQPSLLLPLSRKYGDGRLKIKIFCAGACSGCRQGGACLWACKLSASSSSEQLTPLVLPLSALGAALGRGGAGQLQEFGGEIQRQDQVGKDGRRREVGVETVESPGGASSARSSSLGPTKQNPPVCVPASGLTSRST